MSEDIRSITYMGSGSLMFLGGKFGTDAGPSGDLMGGGGGNADDNADDFCSLTSTFPAIDV